MVAQGYRAGAVAPMDEDVPKRWCNATIPITLDTYSHAIPAMQEEEEALIAGLVFAKA